MQYAWREPLEQCLAGMFTGVPLRRQIARENGVEVKTLLIETPKGIVSQISESDSAMISELRLRKPFVETEADFDKLMSLPRLPYRPGLDSYFRLRNTVGKTNLVTSYLLGPVTVAALYFRPTEFALWTLEQKDKLHALLRKIYQNTDEFLDYLLANKAGEAFWFSGAEEVVPPLGPPSNFAEYITPYEKPLVDKIHNDGGLAILHCHGRVKNVISHMLATGYDVLQPLEAPPMGDITMAAAKRATCGKVCLIGNIQIGDLYRATPERIDQLCRETISQGMPGGGFILGTTASHYSATMDDRTLANYIAYIDAGRKYGRY
jgi:uroporphyrinogen-III decarboxylase